MIIGKRKYERHVWDESILYKLTVSIITDTPAFVRTSGEAESLSLATFSKPTGFYSIFKQI